MSESVNIDYQSTDFGFLNLSEFSGAFCSKERKWELFVDWFSFNFISPTFKIVFLLINYINDIM